MKFEEGTQPPEGTQTQAALKNFGFPELPTWARDVEAPVPRLVQTAVSQVKSAALGAIQETENRWSSERWKALEAHLQFWSGSHTKPYPDLRLEVPLEQGGAGTSLHMNWLENAAQILNRGTGENWDPIEDLNRYQSTNDVIPTALTIVVGTILRDIESQVIVLQEALVALEKRARGVLIVGRTELQDALPMALDQVFGAWGGMAARDRWRISKVQERVRTMALGGTALGTCFFAPRPYIFAAERHLRRVTGLPLCRSQNLPDEVAHGDKYAEAAGALARIAENLWKISGDLSLYTSSLSGEMKHPHVQHGSTLMAYKTNPVFLELVRGLSLDAQGEVFKINQYTQNGQLQLNPFLPFLFRSFLRLGSALWKALECLSRKLLPDLTWDEAELTRRLLGSGVLVNAMRDLVPYQTLRTLARRIQNATPGSWEELRILAQSVTGLPENLLLERLSPGTFLVSGGMK